MKKIFLKGLNTCTQRRQNLLKYSNYIKNRGDILVNAPNDADEIWIWTCGFRGDVKDNTLNYIRKIKGEYRDKTFLLLGCLPEIIPKEFVNEFGGDNNTSVISWKREKQYFTPVNLLFESEECCCEPAICDDVTKYRKLHPDKALSFSDQFIKVIVAEGCNCDCVYCSEKKSIPPI